MGKKDSENTQTGRTEISIAKIGLITAVAVALITCMGTMVPRLLELMFSEPTAVAVESQPIVVATSANVSEPTQMPTLRIEPIATQMPNTAIPPTLTQPPPPTATKILFKTLSIEAESGEMSSGGFPIRDQTAVSASNQAFWLGIRGASLKFTINEMAAGQYELTIRYAKYSNNAEYRDTGYQNLYVNGNSSPILITTFKTYDDTVLKWAELQLIVRLEQGRNTLAIINDVSDQVAGIDRLVLRWIGP